MKYLAPFIILFCVTLQAQVGVGNTSPQATLDVTGKPTIITELDGVIAPRLTGDQLSAKTYTVAQTAAIVYATAADTTPIGQTINVTQAGYYYFNGIIWVSLAAKPESKDWKIAGNANIDDTTDFIGTTTDQDIMFKHNNVQSGWLSTTTTGFGVNNINPIINTGDHNTAIGHTVLRNNTTGNRNTAVGSGAMELNTTGFWNSALGRYALHDNTTGSINMAIGQEASKFNTTGGSNVAIGFAALKNNTTGSNNIAIGRSAMSGGVVGVAYGNNNIAVGYNTQLPSNTANNQMVLGNSITAKTIINGVTNASAPSSSTSTGTKGEVRVSYDATGTNGYYLFICYSTNRWGRVLLDTSF